MSELWNGADTGSSTPRFAPLRGGGRDRALDRFAVPGDHDLLGRVEIDGLDDLPLRGLRAGRGDAGGVEAENRRHRADARGHRLLHRLRAKAHERHASRNASAPAATSAVYSPRLWPATTAGIGPARRLPRAPDGDAGRQHHRLRVHRLVERVLRAVGDERPQILPEHVGRLVERRAHQRMAVEAGHHADRLRALPRKHECDRIIGALTSRERPSPT